MSSLNFSTHILIGIALVVFGEATLLTPIIQTSKGPIQGEILKTCNQRVVYSSFRGIPFAEPPTGYLRFKPPVDKKPWKKVLQATADGNNCVQKDPFFHQYTGSEDCLYLNVYTPHASFSQASLIDLNPVMVWIYGGRFLNGYANYSMYGPDFIIEHGVILVTFNYRLGPLGFLNLDHENATGNAGLKDQNAALKWVQNNIVHFGGNPNSVTLFGQSAGAASVDYHVLSDMSKALFHRSIAMSGSPLSKWSFQKPDSAVRKGFKLGEALGVKTTDKNRLLQSLYEASAEDLMKIAKNMTKVNPAFRPTVERSDLAPNEEKFLTRCPKTLYTKGLFKKAPHMTGTMKHEVSAFISGLIKSNANEIVKEISSSSMLNNLGTKLFFQLGVGKKQELLAINNENPVYYYRISIEPEYSLQKNITKKTSIGAAHGDDLLYLFYIRLYDIPINASLLALTRNRILKLWTNFAKYGNPNLSDEKDILYGVSWPESGKKGKYLDIGEELTVVNHRPGQGVQLKLLTPFLKKILGVWETELSIPTC